MWCNIFIFCSLHLGFNFLYMILHCIPFYEVVLVFEILLKMETFHSWNNLLFFHGPNKNKVHVRLCVSLLCVNIFWDLTTISLRDKLLKIPELLGLVAIVCNDIFFFSLLVPFFYRLTIAGLQKKRSLKFWWERTSRTSPES